MNVTSELIEKNWPLHVKEIKDMPKKGMVGLVGIIVAEEGTYTYKTAGSWKTPENLDRDLGAYEFLNQRKFPHISNLLFTKDKKKFIHNENKLMYLMEYVEGDHPKSDSTTYVELGRITAELHGIPGFPFESDYRPAAAIPQHIEKVKTKDYPFKEELIKTLESIKPFEGLTMVLIHTEMTPGNVIQKPDGKIMVIDWDEVGIGPAVLDLGVGLINHLVTEDFEIKEAEIRAYYNSYFSQRSMSSSEREYIWEAALYWACLWIEYGDPQRRWNKIKWAIENKEKITALYN
jgi:Ser/Thr protein kinase RdoA (MazF antagonist)